MGLFSKNPNEVAYVGGKKHWTDVIKNSGPGELLIWRQPEEDFNTNSTLIVMPGEQAIFIKGGIVEETFDNGTYTLSTENYPFISRLRNAFSGGISTFNCVVYFVRGADSAEIYWGTDSPIQVRDKVWQVRTSVKARGAYKVRITNPSKFLEKLIGNNVPFNTQEDLNKYFSMELLGKVKAAVSDFLNNYENELIGIDSKLTMVSENVEPVINEMLDDYGLKCVKFTVSAMDVDTTKYDEIDTSRIKQIEVQRSYQNDLMGLEMLGNNWAKIQGVEILKDIANNPGAGGVASAGAGLGMGMSAAGAFNSIAQQVFSPITDEFAGGPKPVNPSGPSGRFTQAGNDVPVNSNNVNATEKDPKTALTELKQWLDAGLIDQNDYDEKKKEILSRL